MSRGWREVARYPDERTGGRGISPAVGIVLMVAIVIGLVVVTGYMLLGMTDSMPGGAPQMAVEFDETPAGLVAIPRSIDQAVEVHVNGEPVTTIDHDDLHDRVLLPVAPDDRLAFVADVGDQHLLQAKTVSHSEAGDFIAYYTFGAGSGTTVVDRSANDNDATAFNNPNWVSDTSGSAIEFDGSDDYVKVDQLNAENVTDVEEFTVALKYRVSGSTGDIQQLVEHRNTTTGFEWFLETKNASVPYYPHYSVWPGGVTMDGVVADAIPSGETHVIVGTFDEDTLTLYLDGTLVGRMSRSATIEMGALYLGADAVGATSQHLEGRMYQFRLYYTAFDDEEVETLTSIMDVEAE